MKKVDWIFHYVSNNVICQECGKKENGFPKYICDVHTHGMFKYNHLEFQVVIDYGPEEVGRLLNEMGRRVQAGERFADGDEVEGLYLDCNVQIRQMSDARGRSILRLIIPDKQNKMPEEAGNPHCWQIFAKIFLYALGQEQN